MANEVALRTNFVGGLVENNPLLASDTALTSAALAAAPVVDATSHCTIILDPDGVVGPPEIAWITVHTSGATTAIIQRAVELTSARDHLRDTPWIHAPTAADYGIGASRDRAWQKATAASALDDDFNDASLNSAWVRHDTTAAGSGVVVYTEGADVLNINHAGSASDNTGPAHALLKPIGALTYPLTIEGAFRMWRRYATNYQMVGLLMTDGTSQTSKAVWINPYSSTATATAFTVRTGTWNALNAAETSSSPNTSYELIGGPMYQRLIWSAANTFQSYYSCDGVGWMKLPTGDTSHTMTPTHVGIAMSTWGVATACMGAVEYFRVN